MLLFFLHSDRTSKETPSWDGGEGQGLQPLPAWSCQLFVRDTPSIQGWLSIRLNVFLHAKMLLFWILRLFCICPYCRHSATPINRMCMQYLSLDFYTFGNTVYVVCLGDLDTEIAFLVSRFHCSLDWGKALCWRSKALSRQNDSCISLLSGVLLKVPFNCPSPLWG